MDGPKVDEPALVLKETLRPRLYGLHTYSGDLEFDLLAERDRVIVSVWSHAKRQSRKTILSVAEWAASEDKDTLWHDRIEALLGDIRSAHHAVKLGST